MTYSTIVQSEEATRRVVSRLITCSQWFEVLPLPDDEWKITVKKENLTTLDRLVEECKEPCR